MTTSRSAALEAVLFSEGGPMTRKKACALLSCSDAELQQAIIELRVELEGRGIALVETDTEMALATAKEQSELIRKALEQELSRDIGDAGLEALAIVLYAGPSTRARIDYIRGVNSSSTLRNLIARGLLERAGNPEDAREYLYRPTVELLAHLGVTDSAKLPDYGTIVAELATFEKNTEAHGGTTNGNS